MAENSAAGYNLGFETKHKPNIKAGEIIDSGVIAELVQRVVPERRGRQEGAGRDGEMKIEKHRQGLSPTMTLCRCPGAGTAPGLKLSTQYGLLGAVLIAPTVLIFCAVIVYPLVSAIYLSLFSIYTPT